MLLPLADAARRQDRPDAARGTTALPFAAVNRPWQVGYDPELQRHHILPRQALVWPGLTRLFDGIGREPMGFDDFRRNGLLLPARERTALRLGLPMHRGPHRDYNQMVIERLGRIESIWSRHRSRDCDAARRAALRQIGQLQDRLRRRILDRREPVRFTRADPFLHQRDYTVLDRMAEELWASSGE